MNCPECSANDKTCKARLNQILGLIFSNAGYSAVHHLTIATCMLQHSSKLTREGWIHMRELLREFLIENKSPAFIRNQNKDFVDSDKRKFMIAAKGDLPKIYCTQWTKMILDVRAEDAEVYCADVSAWAQTVLDNTEKVNEIKS